MNFQKITPQLEQVPPAIGCSTINAVRTVDSKSYGLESVQYRRPDCLVRTTNIRLQLSMAPSVSYRVLKVGGISGYIRQASYSAIIS